MRAAAAFILLLAAVACSEPPQKELDRAQGALDAARAAGAEQYAAKEFAAASSALQQAHAAVAQRDYRLALTRALDAGDRAQVAAKGAADGKARARGEAEAAITAAASAESRLQNLIAAQRRTLPRQVIDPAVRTQRAADLTLQKARASLSTGNFTEAKELVRGLETRISAQIGTIEEAMETRTAKPVRRRR